MATKNLIEEKGPAAPAAPLAVAEKGPNDVLRSYYFGLTEKCPLDFITVPTVANEGAPAFCKWTQKTTDRGDGIATLTHREHGGFIKLFDDEVAACKKYIAEHGIFWECRTPGEIRVQIVKLAGDAIFKRSRRDDRSGNVDPLGMYMFMRPAQSVSAQDREEASNLPPTLLQEEETLAAK